MKKNKRIFFPGDQWLYFKIYSNEMDIDNILLDVIDPVIKTLLKRNIILKWFYIRYADPESHLRIRFLINNYQDIGFIMETIHIKAKKFIQKKAIRLIQLDTYNRELERYGIYTTDLAESLFYIDSSYILKTLKLLSKTKDENYRWLSAIIMINDLLDCFKIDIDNKLAIIDQMSTSYKIEFGFNKYNSKQFNTKFREYKKIIEQIINPTTDISYFSDLRTLLNKKNKDLKDIIDSIQVFHNKHIVDVEYLLPSYIHMMLNRLFISSARFHELIIYDFLKRVYQSEIARKKHS